MSNNRRSPFLPVIIAVIVVLVVAIIWWFKPNDNSKLSSQAVSTVLDSQASAKSTDEASSDSGMSKKSKQSTIKFTTGLESDIYLAVNSRYILDFLSHIDSSNFTLGFNDSGLPFTLESDDFMTIVMPIMI